MADVNTKFRKILKELENNIKDKEELEFVKVQMFNLYNILFEEVDRIEEMANNKIKAIIEAERRLEKKAERIEQRLKEIESDIYEVEETNFNITCPYCDNEFLMECDELNEEVKCPECSNIIELDWGNEEEHYHECGGGCQGHLKPEEDDM